MNPHFVPFDCRTLSLCDYLPEGFLSVAPSPAFMAPHGCATERVSLHAFACLVLALWWAWETFPILLVSLMSLGLLDSSWQLHRTPPLLPQTGTLCLDLWGVCPSPHGLRSSLHARRIWGSGWHLMETPEKSCRSCLGLPLTLDCHIRPHKLLTELASVLATGFLRLL